MQITVRHYKTTYQRGDFVIALYLQLDKSDKKFVTCKGQNLPQNKNVYYVFEAEETVYNGKRLYEVSSYSMTQPKTKASIQMFLSGDDFLGIGKDIVKRIVDTYGDKTLEIIETDPGLLINIEGMDDRKLKIIVDGYSRASSYKKLQQFLSPMGISARQIKLIADERIKVEDIKKNPFELSSVKGIGFKTCDTIARYLNTALDAKERIQGGILETLQDSNMSGDNYTIDDDLVKKAAFKLNDGLEKTVVTKKNVIDGVMDLIQKEEIVVENGHNMYSIKYYDAENNTAKQICEFLKCPVDGKEELLHAADMYHATRLSTCQMSAVKRALSNKISVITGGAGTGKTTIVKAIIASYQHVFENEDITLLAPTGKAARRMSEVTGIKASTIHSCLNLYEGSEEPGSYISSGLVIVDEFSMVDQLLFDKLMMALSFNCHLVLIGDINQLSSVGAGACLKDIIESGVVPVSVLTDIFRQNGGTIVDNSRKIIDGVNTLVYDSNMMCVKVNNEEEAVNQIRKIYAYYSSREGQDNVALITPLRSNQNGRFTAVSDSLNGIIQESSNDSQIAYKYGSVVYKLHDRIMMWKNTEFVSNGDVGEIIDLDIDNPEWGMEMTVEWENGNTIKYHKNDLEDFTLAYAMSVHKSQGSEYDTVIVPILKEHKCRLFKKNLLYTAITRAKKRCIILTDDNSMSINYMIANSDTGIRKTGFKDKLIKYAPAM